MRDLIIRILFKLLDGWTSYKDVNQEVIKLWIRSTARGSGVYEYIKKRDYEILKTLGQTSLTERQRDVEIGRRLELLNLLSSLQDALKYEATRINNNKGEEHEEINT
jgi:hypothetical protein